MRAFPFIISFGNVKNVTFGGCCLDGSFFSGYTVSKVELDA